MTADLWSEDARGIWQSQQSEVTQMSSDEMRDRASRWERAFAKTNWIAFTCAGFLLIFFVLMLVVHQTGVQRVGAAIGIFSALYLVGVGLHIARLRGDETTTCVRAYKAQLERRRQADMGSARTIVLMMTGCALLSSPGEWMPWTLQAASQLGAGMVVYVYLRRQAGRFETRINELTVLERSRDNS